MSRDGRSSEESLTRCLCKAGQRAAAAAAQSASAPHSHGAPRNDDDIGSRDANNHLINCLVGGGSIARHDMMVKEISKMVRAAGVQALVEQRSVHQGTGQGGPDLDLQGFPDANTNSFLEVSIINPSQDSMRKEASHMPLAAARVREQAKADKYAEAANVNRRRLYLATVEAHGAFGPSLLVLIRELALREKRNNADPLDNANGTSNSTAAESSPRAWNSRSFRSYWSQRLSITLRRGIVEQLSRHAKATRSYAAVAQDAVNHHSAQVSAPSGLPPTPYPHTPQVPPSSGGVAGKSSSSPPQGLPHPPHSKHRRSGKSKKSRSSASAWNNTAPVTTGWSSHGALRSC